MTNGTIEHFKGLSKDASQSHKWSKYCGRFTGIVVPEANDFYWHFSSR